MRAPRFRVRTLMAAVGLVAVLFCSAMMGLRSYVYYRLASNYSLAGPRIEREHRKG